MVLNSIPSQHYHCLPLPPPSQYDGADASPLDRHLTTHPHKRNQILRRAATRVTDISPAVSTNGGCEFKDSDGDSVATATTPARPATAGVDKWVVGGIGVEIPNAGDSSTRVIAFGSADG